MFATLLRSTGAFARTTTFTRNASLWAAARNTTWRGSGAQTRLGVRFASTEIEDAIKKAIASSKVVLFMKGTPEFPQCGFSRATIQMLGQQGVDPQKFAAYNVLEDDELRQGIKDYSQWPTIPQLYVNQEFVGGCDIVMSMAQSGELAELLEKNDCLVPEEDEEAKEAHIKPADRE